MYLLLTKDVSTSPPLPGSLLLPEDPDSAVSHGGTLGEVRSCLVAVADPDSSTPPILPLVEEYLLVILGLLKSCN